MTPQQAAVLITVDPGDSTGIAVSSLWHNDPENRRVVKELLPGNTMLLEHPMLGRYDLELVEHATVMFDDFIPSFWGHWLPLAYDQRTFRHVPIILAIEAFVITENAVKGNSTWSLEVMGQAEALARVKLGVVTIDKSQQPSQMKNLVHANKVLTELGVKKRGDHMTDHQQDAVGHALLFGARLNNRTARIAS